MNRIVSVISNIRFKRFHALFIVCCVSFSSWLMFHTFSYDTKTDEIKIAFKLWSDFGAHIPLIRSFSMGDNLSRFLHGTVQYPIFPGEPIRYHFLFYMLVGMLERIGLRIDWALNIPSIIGFSLLMASLYYLAHTLTQSRTTSILTIILFLFNGSLGFLRFFQIHPLSLRTLSDIAHAKDFPAFAPWGPGVVTAFWNLNIYTNQRHLALAFAIGMLFILTCIRVNSIPIKKQIPWAIVWALIFGIFPYFHQPMLLIIAIIMATYVLIIPNIRLFLLITGLITTAFVLPQVLAVHGSGSFAEWYPGFTVHNELLALPTIAKKILFFLSYWFQNLGFHSMLIPIGFFFLPKRAKQILLPMAPLFVIPNLFKFSVEASANHKFFNFVMLFGHIISAYTVVLYVKQFNHFAIKYLRKPLQILSGILFVIILTLSGWIDFFVIANDVQGGIVDLPKNPTAQWIAQNTSPTAVFLNSGYLYHPASLAGRAIFLGWPYFAWSAGYKENRMPIMNTLYQKGNAAEVCKLLSAYHISYMTAEDVKNDTNLPTIDLSYYLKTYPAAYVSSDKRYAIFSVSTMCPIP